MKNPVVVYHGPPRPSPVDVMPAAPVDEIRRQRHDRTVVMCLDHPDAMGSGYVGRSAADFFLSLSPASMEMRLLGEVPRLQIGVLDERAAAVLAGVLIKTCALGSGDPVSRNKVAAARSLLKAAGYDLASLPDQDLSLWCAATALDHGVDALGVVPQPVRGLVPAKVPQGYGPLLPRIAATLVRLCESIPGFPFDDHRYARAILAFMGVDVDSPSYAVDLNLAQVCPAAWLFPAP